jgi:hypothetical protein
MLQQSEKKTLVPDLCFGFPDAGRMHAGNSIRSTSSAVRRPPPTITPRRAPHLDDPPQRGDRRSPAEKTVR